MRKFFNLQLILAEQQLNSQYINAIDLKNGKRYLLFDMSLDVGYPAKTSGQPIFFRFAQLLWNLAN